MRSFLQHNMAFYQKDAGNTFKLHKWFAVQFLVFITLVLITSGAFYAVERHAHDNDWTFDLHEFDIREADIQYPDDHGNHTQKNETSNHHDAVVQLIANFSKEHKIHADEINDFLHRLHDAEEMEMPHLSSYSPYKMMTYQEAFVMTLAIFYTIGWGDVTPITSGGKILTIVISMVGIPLTFIMLATAGQIIAQHTFDLTRSVKKKLHHRFATSIDYEEESDVVPKYVIVPVLASFLLLYILIGSSCISSIEGFTYKEAVYYSFISLSTIGFGDYLISQHATEEHDLLGKRAGVTIFIFFWLLIGLSLIAALLIVVLFYSPKKTNHGTNFIYKSSSTDNIVGDVDDDLAA